MARFAEAIELLDVDVDQFAGTFALIAPDRFGRIDVARAAQGRALEDAADDGGRDASRFGDVFARERRRRSAITCATIVSVVAR